MLLLLPFLLLHLAHLKKMSKKNSRKRTISIPASSLLLKPLQSYGPNIDCFLDSSISTLLVDFFNLLSHDLIEEIVTQAIVYTQQKGTINFSLTKEKMICFIGILLVSEYHPIPFHRLSWSNQPACSRVYKNQV